jgi:AcrR family transcriptional regulator
MKFKMKKKNIRQAQAEERRLQILDISLSVFASNGFKGTSIKDIAEAAGISQGLMYHYFPSKESLLEATVEQHSFLPQLRRMLKDAKKRPTNEVFKDIAIGFLELLDSKADLIKIFIQEIGSNQAVKNTWANLCREGVSLLQEYIESQVSIGELRRHNTEVTARSLFSTLFMHHFTRDVFQSSRLKREEFVNEVLSDILCGISAK